ncbi:methyltransferase domain-containing protein [Paenibacillus sp. YPG26]|uniref:methyltransferase domain-containing protein n=1 Tax=Paenibacillus sp. YPG26 TaxID=2878915 RepID=UPI00203FEFF8|nr:methyltransferase domain-containing protein [Paenibacillus sp. YPG26]USB31685.1 methyltransferase domain-containing protein [Paenibacillus sp. YPG26]
MPFFRTLRERAQEDELMDDFSMGGEELSEALQHLRRLNTIFPAAGPVLHGVEKLWILKGRPASLSILDVGAGSGDINSKLLKWAAQRGISMHITLVDMTKEACDEARRLFQKEPRVEVWQGNVKELAEGSADIVTGSQFLHHFDGDELIDMVFHMLKASKYGVVINDIHRHRVSYTAVWLMTRMISRNRYIRHDGPLSVAKGFKARDWQELKTQLNHGTLTYDWKPLFRYCVVIPKAGSEHKPY